MRHERASNAMAALAALRSSSISSSLRGPVRFWMALIFSLVIFFLRAGSHGRSFNLDVGAATWRCFSPLAGVSRIIGQQPVELTQRRSCLRWLQRHVRSSAACSSKLCWMKVRKRTAIVAQVQRGATPDIPVAGFGYNDIDVWLNVDKRHAVSGTCRGAPRCPIMNGKIDVGLSVGMSGFRISKADIWPSCPAAQPPASLLRPGGPAGVYIKPSIRSSKIMPPAPPPTSTL